MIKYVFRRKYGEAGAVRNNWGTPDMRDARPSIQWRRPSHSTHTPRSQARRRDALSTELYAIDSLANLRHRINYEKLRARDRRGLNLTLYSPK